MALVSQMMRFLPIWLLSIPLVTTTSNFLDLCPVDPNAPIGNSWLTWAQVFAQPISRFDQSSYIRPDIGRYRWSTRGNHELIVT